MAFYPKMQGTASRLLGKYGEKITMQRTVPGTYDPATGETAGDTELEWSPHAVKTGINKELFAGDAQVGGTRIEAGDMHILVDCKGQPHIPQRGDRVVLSNGEIWSVLVDMPVEPAGMTVLYKGIIRRG